MVTRRNLMENVELINGYLSNGMDVPKVQSPFHIMNNKEIYNATPSRYYNKGIQYPQQLNMFTIQSNQKYIQSLKDKHEWIKLNYIKHTEPALYYLQCK